MVLSLLMFSDMTSRIHSELVMMDEEGNKRFVSDREIAVNEVEKSKRERKKKHLMELQNAEDSQVKRERPPHTHTHTHHTYTHTFSLCQRIN